MNKITQTDDAGHSAEAWPTEINLARDTGILTVGFDTGERYELAAEYLRVKSPSAEVQGHSPAERKLQYGKRNVAITEIRPVGNYAIRLVFSDGHDSGLYTWKYLRELGRDHATLWPAYLAELEAAGKSR